VTLTTLAERPELAAGIPDLLAARWPAFLLGGAPGHGADLTGLILANPGHQVVLTGEDGTLAGAGLSVPVRWDGTRDGLPAGWDGAVAAAARLHADGGRPDAACALSITLAPAASGRGNARRLLDALRAATGRAGGHALIAPVRPVYKSRYPLIAMDRYLTWRTPTGEPFDPWLRLHTAAGGRVLGVAYPSMSVTGSVAAWSAWTGMALPGHGSYLVPGGLVPLRVRRDAQSAVYREPNVWVSHPAG
jgi:hypothetical protein